MNYIKPKVLTTKLVNVNEYPRFPLFLLRKWDRGRDGKGGFLAHQRCRGSEYSDLRALPLGWLGDYIYEKPAVIRAAELEKVFYSARESAVASMKTPCQCRKKKM